jgi:hypothetical protein
MKNIQYYVKFEGFPVNVCARIFLGVNTIRSENPEYAKNVPDYRLLSP